MKPKPIPWQYQQAGLGDSSDVFRKAFHQENTSMARKTDNEYFEIKDPHLAICLSGTPKQVHNTIPEVENGLFSRFMYYAFKDNRGFMNPFVSYSSINYNQFFISKGYQVYHLLKNWALLNGGQKDTSHFLRKNCWILITMILKKWDFLTGKAG